MSVTDETGGRFPIIPFIALVWPEGQIPEVGSNAEYVQVIGRTGDQMQIVRSGAPLAIEASWMFAAVETVPNYERGDTVTMIGHFTEHVPPYTVHVRQPTGEQDSYGSAAGVTDDGIGNAEYEFVPEKSGIWAYRWEGANGMLEDNAFFVNYSTAL